MLKANYKLERSQVLPAQRMGTFNASAIQTSGGGFDLMMYKCGVYRHNLYFHQGSFPLCPKLTLLA